MKRLTLWLAQLALVGACVAYAVYAFDIPKVLAALSQVPPWQAALAVAGQCVLCWPVSLVRLMALCRSQVPWQAAFLTLCLGQIMNILLPAKLGEAAKIAMLTQNLEGDVAQATEITFWERFADLNALLAMLLFSGPVLGGMALALPVALATAGLWLAVLGLKHWGGAVPHRLARLPWPRLGGYLAGVVGALRVRLTPGFALGLGLLTLPIWLGEVLLHGYVLRTLFHLPLSPLEVLAVSSAGIAGKALPATPAGIGLYEAAIVGALAALGHPAEQALAAALVLHLVIVLPKFISGGWAMAKVGARVAMRLGG